ncbi:MAG: dTMP kinase [Gammaproteobacteria bacterium]|nr:dTMP kinase [Gammaproteobacteria bacterium]
MKGRFITVEGIEGAGKTTCMDSIKELLTKSNIGYVSTREPGGTLLAEKIRNLLLDVDEDPPVALTELLLIFAARAQHIQKVIIPALSDGLWVLCDRFTDATFAYQGGGRGMEDQLIAELEKITQQALRPDMTFYLDLSPELGLARAKKRGNLDRFEKEELEFFNNVRRAYLRLAEKNRDRYITIDAKNTEDRVAKEIKEILIDRFSLK